MTLPRGSSRLFRFRSVDRDLDEELNSYFEHTIEELMAQGRTRAQAIEEASARFGDRSAYRRALRAIDLDVERRRRWGDRLDAMWQSITYATRSLARSPGLSLGIVLTFALGIGANATMYGIVERLLLKPPAHIVDGENVRRLYAETYLAPAGRRIAGSTFGYPEFRDLQSVRAFAGVAAYATQDVVVGHGETAEETLVTWVTGNFFDLLGVQPVRGRFFTPAEDKVGGAKLAVISHGYWQRKFGGAADVPGRTVDFGNGVYTVIGVTPRGFTGAELTRTDFWIPMHVAVTDAMGTSWENDRSWGWFELIARLKPGVTAEAASAEATAIFAAAWAEAVARGDYGKDPALLVAPILAARGPLARGEALVTQLLLAVSLVVLLIACVNVANLMLARTIKQTREIAVRLAIGISRTRLIAQTVLQGVLLSLAGGVAALAFYHWGGAFVRKTLLPDVAWEETGLTPGMIMLVGGIAILAGVITSVVPALKAARGELAGMLRQAGAGGITRTTARVRTTLVLLQTALSVLLLVGAGLFVRSLDRVQQLELGVDVDGLYMVYPRSAPNAITQQERHVVLDQIAERFALIPGVESVGRTESFPFVMRRSHMPRAEGVDSIRQPPNGSPLIQQVSPGYFEAMGLRVLRGRGFAESDSENAPRVAMVNQALARWIWGEQDPIGKCLYIPRTESRCSRVVGVLEDALHNPDLRQPLPVAYYTPLAQKQLAHDARVLVIRVPNMTPAIGRALQREVIAADPRMRFAQVQSMQQMLAPSTRSWTLGATMFSVFGVLALIVSALGLYSVLAFDIAQRTRELGVRAALGASRGLLVGMVVRRAVVVTVAGVASGAIIAVALGGRLESMLFNVSPHDPVTFVAVAIVLLGVALVAGLIPGWRAARIDPTTALRA